MDAITMTIDGAAADAPRVEPVLDPATAEPFATAPVAGAAEVDAAVEAAQRACAAWAARPWAERQALLGALSRAVREREAELAELLVREQGKPLAKARSEIASALLFFDAYVELELPDEVLRDTPAQRVLLQRRPLGPVAAITAWNYPVLLALWKIGPALVAGNTVVVKPAPTTPLATLRIGEIARGVLPPGVLNVVSGDGETGARLAAHPLVRKVSFTGSIPTGKRIMAAAAPTVKRLTLELGGNDAGIVLDDVDARAIANDLFWAKFSNCGQVCAGLKRLLVPASRFDEVCAALVDVARGVKVAPGHDPDAQMGPIQNRMQHERIRAMVDDALALGARVLFRGEAPAGGYFHPVTILTEARDGMRVVDEEAFGPVLSIQRYHSVDAAVARANAGEYGLGGSVWSADPERAAAVAARLEVGSAWVNQHPAMGPDIPFGGVKESGLGVEIGRLGLEQYTDIRVLNVKR